jgi:hypothetical protein
MQSDEQQDHELNNRPVGSDAAFKAIEWASNLMPTEKVTPTFARASLFSGPACTLLGYLFGTISDPGPIGVGLFLPILVGVIGGSVLGLWLLGRSKRANEDADSLRVISLTLNWGAPIFILAFPFIIK